MTRDKYLKRLFYVLIFVLGVSFGISLWATVEKQVGEKPINQSAQTSSNDKHQEEPFWESVRNTAFPDSIAVYTLVLTLATVGLWFATNRLWRSGEKQVEILGQQTAIVGLQTDIAEKAHALERLQVIATHRPRIIIRFIQGPFKNDNGQDFVWITVVNVGATNATIFEAGCDLVRRVRKIEWLGVYGWRRPGIDASPKEITPVTVKSGERFVLTATCKSQVGKMGVLETDEICAVGAVKYRDAIDTVRETGFFRVFEPANGRFIIEENEDGEYVD